MLKFNWNVKAFDFTDQHRGAYRVEIEEAEDKLSEASMLLKQARTAKLSEQTIGEIDEILTQISSSLDKVRKLRAEMKSFS